MFLYFLIYPKLTHNGGEGAKTFQIPCSSFKIRNQSLPQRTKISISIKVSRIQKPFVYIPLFLLPAYFVLNDLHYGPNVNF